MTSKTKDPVNQFLFDVEREVGLQRLGLMTNQTWLDDPRRLSFTLARYKFVSKVLSGQDRVLEIGCGDGFCSRVVAQEVGHLTITDYDPAFIDDANGRAVAKWPITAQVHDMLQGPLDQAFDAAYMLDVLEHIDPASEPAFMRNVVASLSETGTLIVGIPSLESQAYASAASKEGHVNCKSGVPFRTDLLRYFNNVFVFSMNDEVVHTGYFPMAHYLLAICCGPKRT